MERYPKYKDSGIDWLGNIPEHWDIIKIKRLSIVKRGASPRPIDQPKYFDDNGEFAWVRIADVTASNKYLLKTTQTLSKLGNSLSVKQYPGDFFVSIAGSVGKPIITKIKCCIHDGFVYFPKLKINKEFIYYLFEAGQLFQGLGKFSTQLNLNTDTIGNIQIPLPPLEEQKTIARFLDRKLEQIGHFISNKQRLIELLKEQKTAIVNRAVTKGLNTDAPMKPSGIERLGEIPAHWKILKLKYISNIRYGLGQPPREKEGGLPLIRATNVERGKIVEKDLLFIDPEDVPYGRTPILKEGEIIVVRSGAYTADSAIIPKKFEGAIAGYDMVVKARKINCKLLSYIFLSNYVLTHQLYVLRMRAAQPHLNSEELGQTFIVSAQ